MPWDPTRREAGLVGLALLLAAVMGPLAGVARAQPDYAVSVEGGLGSYTGSLGSALRLGGVWGVRAERFVTPFLEVGLAYVGGANQIVVDSSAPSQPVLQRDGGEASAKALLLGGKIRPYLELGLGVTRFHVRGGDPGPDVHGATMLSVPFGLGVQANAGVIRVGAGVGSELLVGNRPVEAGGGLRLDARIHLGAVF